MNATIPLGELVSIRGGGTPSRSKKEFWGGPIPWATVKDFKTTSLDSTLESITEEGVRNSATNVISAGSIVVPTRMAVGKAAINTVDVAINQDLKALTPIGEVDTRFLLHFLLSKSNFLEDQAQGATVKGIKLDLLKSLPFPDLPLHEQHRIAAILDKADAIRLKREQAVDLADEFLKSVFLEMFGDPVTNPRNWPVGSVGEGLSGIVGGWSAKGDARPASSEELGVLKISAVTSGYFRPEENKVVHGVPAERQIIIPQKGDLLFSRANTRELVAATCIVTKEKPNVFLPDKLWRMDLDPNVFEAPFLKFVLTHSEYRRLLCEKATGTSGSMLNISKAKLVDHEIPLPPIEEQIKFSKIWWRTQNALTTQKSALRGSFDLFNSLSHRAFRGEL